MVQDPVILVGEDDQTTGDPTPMVPTSISNSISNVPAEHILLQDMEGADALRFREPVVFATMYDQHRRSPLVDEIRGVVSTSGARMSLIQVPCPADTAAGAEHALCEVRLGVRVPRPASPLFVELCGRHVRVRDMTESQLGHARKRARQWSSRCRWRRTPEEAISASRLSSSSSGATHAVVAN